MGACLSYFPGGFRVRLFGWCLNLTSASMPKSMEELASEYAWLMAIGSVLLLVAYRRQRRQRIAARREME